MVKFWPIYSFSITMSQLSTKFTDSLIFKLQIAKFDFFIWDKYNQALGRKTIHKLYKYKQTAALLI